MKGKYCKCCEEKGIKTFIEFTKDNYIGTMDGQGYKLDMYNCPECDATVSNKIKE